MLDTIIINAGILLGEGRIEDLSPADLLKNLEGNVVGPHIITKAFSPFLLESKAAKKTLAYISSGVGSVGASKQVGEFIKKMYNVDYIPNGGYATTKTALNGLGRQWADSLEPKGIAVILVHRAPLVLPFRWVQDADSVLHSWSGAHRHEPRRGPDHG